MKIRAKASSLHKWIELALVSLLFSSGFICLQSLSPQASVLRYSYDSAGRLTLVNYGDGTGIRYTYDTAGNLVAGSVVSIALNELTILLQPGRSVSSSSIGSASVLRTGYATVASDFGVAYGTAVLSYARNGVVLGEVGVPAPPPTRSIRFFVEQRTGIPAGIGSVTSGFAVVNLGTDTASLTLRLRDARGVLLSVGNIQVAKNGHLARFIDELAPDFVVPNEFALTGFGSLEIASDRPLSVVALRSTTNQRGDVLLTTTPIADLERPDSNGSLIFPQIADGGGYTTALTFLNTSDQLETGAVSFFDDDGAPLAVKPAGTASSGSQFPYSIPAGGILRLVSDGSPPDLHLGWARMLPDDGTSKPVGGGVFSLSRSGILITESGVPAALPTTHALIYIDRSRGHDTGLAIINPNGSSSTVTLTAFASDGNANANSGVGNVNLPANGHQARFVGQLISGGLPDGFTGVLDIRSTKEFAALTLRSLTNARGDFLLTTFPVADGTRPPPSPVLFPQVVDGGGYRTQFVLLNTGNVTTKLTLKFLGDDGQPISIGQ